MTLNPALTGQFRGDYRLNSNFKNQWSSVSEPFQTFSFSGEANRLIRSYQPLSFGLVFLTDQAGAGNLKTNQFNISLGQTWKLNADSSLSAGAGLQFGLTGRSIDFNAFSFDQQYNGSRFNNSRSNGETFERNSFNYLNLNLGTNLNYHLDRRKYYSLGLSFYNLNQANQSFQNSNIPLDIRSQFYLRINQEISEKLDLQPSIYYSSQGTFSEVFFGSNLKYYYSSSSSLKRNLYAGLWYRNKDAFIAMVGMDYNEWRAGVSYDINVSDLDVASNNRGGIEFSLIYIIDQFKPMNRKFKRCPKFI